MHVCFSKWSQLTKRATFAGPECGCNSKVPLYLTYTEYVCFPIVAIVTWPVTRHCNETPWSIIAHTYYVQWWTIACHRTIASICSVPQFSCLDTSKDWCEAIRPGIYPLITELYPIGTSYLWHWATGRCPRVWACGRGRWVRVHIRGWNSCRGSQKSVQCAENFWGRKCLVHFYCENQPFSTLILGSYQFFRWLNHWITVSCAACSIFLKIALEL